MFLLPCWQGVSFDTNSKIAAYKIIYLLLGGLALCVGIAVLIFMPDSPTNARFLTKEERIAAIERIRDDQGGTENKTIKKEQLIEAVTDIRTWLVVLSTLLSPYSILRRRTTRDSSMLTSDFSKYTQWWTS